MELTFKDIREKYNSLEGIRIVGIDTGEKGALVDVSFTDDNPVIWGAYELPSKQGFRQEFVKRYKDLEGHLHTCNLIAVELTHSMNAYQSTPRSNYSMGFSLGMFILLLYNNLDHIYLLPAHWQRTVLEDYGKKSRKTKNIKNISEDKVHRMGVLDQLSLKDKRGGDRLIPHDGMIDAFLIAYSVYKAFNPENYMQYGKNK